MKSLLNVIALVLLLFCLVALFSNYLEALPLYKLLDASNASYDAPISGYLPLITLFRISASIVIALWLAWHAKRLREPVLVWAVLGLAYGPLALILFIVLRAGGRIGGEEDYSLQPVGLIVVLVVIGAITSILNPFLVTFWTGRLGSSADMRALALHNSVQSYALLCVQGVVHIGVAIWLVLRSSRYGDRPFLAFFTGLVLGIPGALILECWYLWKRVVVSDSMSDVAIGGDA